jgi:hypothetical protein
VISDAWGFDLVNQALRQLDRGDQIVVGDIDGGIHQPALNRPVRQQFRLGQ